MSLAYYLSIDAVTAFSDGLSRLIIARGISDSLTPNIDQSGLIWPPVTQWSMYPFARIDFLYHSGLAGSIPSMLAFFVLSYYLYRFTRLMTKKNQSQAAFVAVVALAVPSMIFMQTTPMAEVIFAALTMGSGYYIAVFLHNPDRDFSEFSLLQAGGLAALACWTRYEGYVGFGLLFVVLFLGIRQLKLPEKHRTFDSMVYFGILPALALIAWLVINYKSSGNALYFLTSEYAPSSYAHKAMEALPPGERTAYNPLLSFKVFALTTVDNVGWINSAAALTGMSFFALAKNVPWPKKLVAIWLLYPFPLFIASICFGGSVVILHPQLAEGANWGTRYGVLMVPGAAFFIGDLSTRIRKPAYLLPLILVSFAFTWNHGNISLDEALANRDGEDSVLSEKIGAWLGNNYDGGQILIDASGSERVVHSSQLYLNQAVRNVNGSYWTESLDNPVGNRWIFMRTPIGGSPDAVWQKYHDSPVIKDRYNLVFQDLGVEIYKLK